MRTMILLVAMLGTAAGAAAPAGFAAVAAAGRVVEMRAPLWMNGAVTLGADTRGTVSRKSLGDTRSAGLQDVVLSDVRRHGGMRFALTGPAAGGDLAGECGFDRSETQVARKSLQLSVPAEALVMDCRFTRNGADAGVLLLDGAPASGKLVQPAARVGEIRTPGATLMVRSVHHLAGTRLPTDTPVGYEFLADGKVVGALDLTRAKGRPIALPADAAQADAVTLAAVALGLFWDPGDTD